MDGEAVVQAYQMEDGPRERLLRLGASALRIDELLACIMQSGNGRQNVYAIARSVVNHLGGLDALADIEVAELLQIPGIGRAKAVQIAAAVELGRRIARKPATEKRQIRTADDAAKYVMDRMRYLKKEHFVTLLLDTRHRVLAEDTSSIGSLDASIVHPREIFRRAVRCSASGILCVHNHPSGDPSPSPEDIAVTRRLVEAGRLLGIDVLDHIVIGDGKYVSLRAAGYLDHG
ncbi:DNA replication and repair protein RadC [Alicyclobacillus sacchari]|uniref:DNA replication and repair protein RadC n=1 Tax=Alicyclobacillus sacchari TaxID=392010 RepID=A0A4R8LJ10_9BACL|nr:DNA repair protein RadC [Alicyclobacillus sacchari]TDY43358.1 DNA replication and repair protein RadC [Alicyclobacillus sacchari]